MKRFLALSVVLVMLLCSFTSCDLIDEIINGEFETEEKTEKSTDKDTERSTEKSTVASTERVTEPHWWDDGLYEDLNDKINGGTNKNETNKPETDSIANMEAINDTVYVLYDANIRDKTNTKATILGKAPFGAALVRSAKNSAWSKVTYVTDSGAAIEGYVMNELITTNKQTVTFVEQKNADGGEVVTKLKGSSTYRLRHFPLANGYPHTVTLELSEIGLIYGGTEVTVLSVSEDKMWAYIRCSYVDMRMPDGEYCRNNFEEHEGYIVYEFLEISDDNTEDSAQQPVGSAVG